MKNAQRKIKSKKKLCNNLLDDKLPQPLKSEEIIIILNIRGPLDVNTKSFYLDIFYFFRQNMDSLHHINIL